MLQVQNGRLHFNWLGESGGPYARYPGIRTGFEQAVQRFQEFLKQENLGELRPNQWEVTYLNHIPKGTVWNAVIDWNFCRLVGDLPTYQELIEPESFRADWHFVIPNQRGRLHVEWQHAHRTSPDPKEIVVLNLTARGPLNPEKIGIETILAGVDLGRQTIVKTFQKIMSDEANAYWGIEYANG